MVSTDAQQVSIFGDADHMGLSDRDPTLYLVLEGIARVYDLSYWDEDDWDQWNSNLQEA